MKTKAYSDISLQQYEKGSDYNIDVYLRVSKNIEDFEEFLDLLIKPLCLAAGYQQGTLDKYFKE